METENTSSRVVDPNQPRIIYVDNDIHRMLRVHAADRATTVRQLASSLLRDAMASMQLTTDTFKPTN